MQRKEKRKGRRPPQPRGIAPQSTGARAGQSQGNMRAAHPIGVRGALLFAPCLAGRRYRISRCRNSTTVPNRVSAESMVLTTMAREVSRAPAP